MRQAVTMALYLRALAIVTDSDLLIRCNDLDAAIAAYIGTGDYRLDLIMPADAPRIALLSGAKGRLRLELDQPPTVHPDYQPDALHISRAGADDAWAVGRAGMHYRDLLPSRAGGRYIASHIRIVDGGPVNDYVHFHQVGFQLIYCRRGWVRVVYEDQGPPFVLQAGDCVLQPPTIRHRVLEAAPGLEVIEIASPSEHPTFRDHTLNLPTSELRPDRDFGGQRFTRHVAADAGWQASGLSGFSARGTHLAEASAGAVALRVLRAQAEVAAVAWPHSGRALRFLHVLAGCAELASPEHGRHALAEGDSAVLPARGDFTLAAAAGCELLEIVSG